MAGCYETVVNSDNVATVENEETDTLIQNIVNKRYFFPQKSICGFNNTVYPVDEVIINECLLDMFNC